MRPLRLILNTSLLLVLTLAPRASAQDASDLFVLTLESDGDEVSLSVPVRLTDRDGYDNQPAFSADGSRLFFTSMRAVGEGEEQAQQSDIWQIDLGDLDKSAPGEPTAFRQTPATSEYSPTPIPGHDALSVIRVEEDGRQRLWRLPLDVSKPATLILPDVEPVGYHAWSDDARQLILFVLDEPHRLVRVSFEEPAERPGEPRTVYADIGRSLHYLPGEDAFSFIDKKVEDAAAGWPVALIPAGAAGAGSGIERLPRLPEGREDVAFAGGVPWVGDGSRLLRLDTRGKNTWREVADLGRFGISGITRLAFDADGRRLALVARRSPKKVRRLGIVERAIEHHGGELFTSSETELRQCSRSGCSTVLARLDGGRFLYDVSGPRRDETRRVRMTNDSLELWRDGKKTPAPGGDDSEQAQRLRDWVMARVYFPFLPFRLDDASVWKQDLGVESWNGRPLHKVRVTFDAGSSTDSDDVYLYWFDPETAEMVQFAYSYSGDPGGLRFRVLEKPRRVGGLLFHDQKNYGTEGEGMTVERLTPASVRDLRLVSTVTFDEISVRALDEADP